MHVEGINIRVVTQKGQLASMIQAAAQQPSNDGCGWSVNMPGWCIWEQEECI